HDGVFTSFMARSETSLVTVICRHVQVSLTTFLLISKTAPRRADDSYAVRLREALPILLIDSNTPQVSVFDQTCIGQFAGFKPCSRKMSDALSGNTCLFARSHSDWASSYPSWSVPRLALIVLTQGPRYRRFRLTLQTVSKQSGEG